ncbi:MAG: hypothetical protein J3K34DRAFT_521714 [Monoraphidium minutum]|nr:MAG: hypothetical protein J3K34DRAFT_521714 [Monoraphidium minutum]
MMAARSKRTCGCSQARLRRRRGLRAPPSFSKAMARRARITGRGRHVGACSAGHLLIHQSTNACGGHIRGGHVWRRRGEGAAFVLDGSADVGARRQMAGPHAAAVMERDSLLVGVARTGWRAIHAQCSSSSSSRSRRISSITGRSPRPHSSCTISSSWSASAPHSHTTTSTPPPPAGGTGCATTSGKPGSNAGAAAAGSCPPKSAPAA